MSELQIKVNIADRHYPLKIAEADEARVREAANMINQRVKAYFEHFSVKDKQDVLAMCALELATENLSIKDVQPVEDHRVAEAIARLSESLRDIEI
ncbi:MAG: cell division protein ZapA [Bacteroidia bacterium]|nr:cell division protein ZapA [Bacteroidia bacterium]